MLSLGQLAVRSSTTGSGSVRSLDLHDRCTRVRVPRISGTLARGNIVARDSMPASRNRLPRADEEQGPYRERSKSLQHHGRVPAVPAGTSTLHVVHGDPSARAGCRAAHRLAAGPARSGHVSAATDRAWHRAGIGTGDRLLRSRSDPKPRAPGENCETKREDPPPHISLHPACCLLPVAYSLISYLAFTPIASSFELISCAPAA